MNNTDNDQKDESMDNQASKDIQHQGANMCEIAPIQELNHDAALARIFVSGLSLFCCNPSDGRGELGFIAEHHELLVMNIYRNDDCEKVFWSSEKDFPHSMEKVGITINTTSSDALCRKYENGDEDDQSYSQMPDLAKLHKVKKFEKRQNASAGFSARVDIRDAIFYTYKMTESKAVLLERNNPHDCGEEINSGKKIGKILGADIISDEEIKIEIRYKQGKETEIYNVPSLKLGDKYAIVLITRPKDEENGHATGTEHEKCGHIELIYKNIIKKPRGHSEYDYKFDPEEKMWDYCPPKKLIATQFACESTGGGEGPLPAFPPDA